MSFYSDNGVDEYLAQHLPDFGYACDVGASEGFSGSNTLALEERGWLVICVEPNPMLEKAGRHCRKLWRQVACGSEDCEARELIVVGSYPYASSTGLNIVYGPCPVENIAGRVMVKVRTLDRLLEEVGFPCLDVLTIDVEGYEGEVLLGFTVERWKPKFIVVEDCDGSTLTHKYLPPPGYSEVAIRQFDRIWQRNPE
jgi:FkbM family methyltransferase